MKAPKSKDVLPRLKVWLLKGKTITHNQAQSKWGTNRIAEYVARLRRKGFKIYTEMRRSNGDVYGVYSMNKPDKIFFS